MRMLLVTTIVYGLFHALALPAERDVDVALVFAVDFSASINVAEAKLQRDGHAKAITDPDVLAAIKGSPGGCIAISYLEWSGAGHTRLLLPWTHICGEEDARLAAELIRRTANDGGQCIYRCDTSISGAIDAAVLLLDGVGGHPYRMVIDISSNGFNNDGPPLQPSRARAVERGYTINVIALPYFIHGFSYSMKEYFVANVIGGHAAFVMEADDKHDYAIALQRKLVREISMGRRVLNGLAQP
jgi:hypothetical protein